MLARKAVTLGLGYYGAGMLIHPPAMSPMVFFPDKYGMVYERISFRSADGLALAGWFVPSPSGGDKTLLICHGWGDNKGQILEQTQFLNRSEGFNLLYFDFRGHGESEGDQVTLGKQELLDFAAAVDYLKTKRPRSAANLGVFGLSHGRGREARWPWPDYPEIKAAVLEEVLSPISSRSAAAGSGTTCACPISRSPSASSTWCACARATTTSTASARRPISRPPRLRSS